MELTKRQTHEAMCRWGRVGVKESREEGLGRQEEEPGESRKLAELRQQAVKCLASSCIV